MVASKCELQLEGCKTTTMMMFEVGPLGLGRGPTRKACSACWLAMTQGGKMKEEKPRKHQETLPKVMNRQRSMYR